MREIQILVAQVTPQGVLVRGRAGLEIDKPSGVNSLARGAWLVGHNAVQAVWKQAGEEAVSTARFDTASRVNCTPQVGSAI